MRESSPHESLELPRGEHLEHIQKGVSMHYIYIGIKEGESFVRFDDEIIPKKMLEQQLSTKLRHLSSVSTSPLAVSLNIDGQVEMELVEDVKQILRRSKVSTVDYVGIEATTKN